MSVEKEEQELRSTAVASLAASIVQAVKSRSAMSITDESESIKRAQWAIGSIMASVTMHHRRAFKRALEKTLIAFGQADEKFSQGLSVLSPSDLVKMFVGTLEAMMEKTYKDFPEREYMIVPRYPNLATTLALSVVLSINGLHKDRICYDLYRIVSAVGSVTAYTASELPSLTDSPKKTFSIKEEPGTDDWTLPLSKMA